jgi:hypothetical protein
MRTKLDRSFWNTTKKTNPQRRYASVRRVAMGTVRGTTPACRRPGLTPRASVGTIDAALAGRLPQQYMWQWHIKVMEEKEGVRQLR